MYLYLIEVFLNSFYDHHFFVATTLFSGVFIDGLMPEDVAQVKKK